MGDLLDDILNDDNDLEAQAAAQNTDDDAANADDQDQGDDGQQANEPTIAEVMKMYEEMQRQNKGLIKDLQGERSKRQTAQGQFQQLSSTVSDILKRQSEPANDNQQQATFKGIPVAETEDGEMYVPQEHINTLVSQITQNVDSVRNQIDAVSQAQAAKEAAEAQLNAVIGSKPEYSTAYNELKSAYSLVNKHVIDLLEANDASGTVLSGSQVLELMHRGEFPNLKADFEKAYPDLQLDQVIRSHDTTYDLTSTLDAISSLSGQSDVSDAIKDADKQTKTGEGDDSATQNKSAHSDVFQKVLKKPSSLSTVANSKGSAPDAFEKLAGLSSEDFLDNLTDADVEKLERAMEREERNQYS
jgi:hypothetical protein